MAPSNHARSDWIGIYPEGVNKNQQITQVSSQGHWIGLYPDEWSGNDHISNQPQMEQTSAGIEREAGLAKFDTARRLPPKVGNYELR